VINDKKTIKYYTLKEQYENLREKYNSIRKELKEFKKNVNKKKINWNNVAVLIIFLIFTLLILKPFLGLL
jgi:uncharacterized membrane protein YvbJ